MSDLENSQTLKTLEFDIVLDLVSDFTVSSIGRYRIQNLPFLTNKNSVQEELLFVHEMLELLNYDDPFPLSSFNDLSPSLSRARVIGAFLQTEEFVAIRDFLFIVRQVVSYFDEKSEKYPLVIKQLKSLIPLPDFEKNINKIIDSKGDIKDRASDTLSRIRRTMERKSSQLRQRLQQLLQQMNQKGYTQENVLSLREGRLTLPLKETHRRVIPGIVLDLSASGATVFVEPIEAVEMGNEIRQLQIEEKREIERLLLLLTDQVRVSMPELEENQRVAGRVDSWAARAKYGISIDACAGEVSESEEIVLKNAYHPLLIAKHGKKNIIPLSIRINDDLKCVVITGPNAGGKTVALKTVGLLALMHQHGMLIPARHGSALPCFSSVFADIGDQQSIDQDLSTFSSHIQNLKNVVVEADNHSLILLDEIGSSTDPAEGAALATAILEHLTSIGARTFASTHMSELKVFAHEYTAIENGSMIFDQKTLKPTYQFQLGIPGASYAFEIAERYGLPKDIVQNAQKKVGSSRGQLESLINAIEKEHQNLSELRSDAERKDSQLSGLIALYEDKVKKISKESEARKKELLFEVDGLLSNAQSDIENLIREIKESQAERASIQKAKKTLAQYQAKRKKISAKPREKELNVQKGDWVRWSGHGGLGQIISQPDSDGRVIVQWNDVRLKISKNQLEKTDPPKKEEKSSKGFITSKAVSSEIDLRGLLVDEALPQIDQYLGDAAVAGLHQVCVIHGKGTGALRKAVGDYLGSHPLVKKQRLGNWDEGDTGVTIAELK